jgi:hypothetical protein
MQDNLYFYSYNVSPKSPHRYRVIMDIAILSMYRFIVIDASTIQYRDTMMYRYRTLHFCNQNHKIYVQIYFESPFSGIILPNVCNDAEICL